MLNGLDGMPLLFSRLEMSSCLDGRETHKPKGPRAMNLLSSKVFLLACIVINSCVFAIAQQTSSTQPEAPTLTNESILELFEAGFSAETIIRRIKQSRCRFDTTPSQMEKLKSRGVPASIVKAMVEASLGLPTSTKNNDADKSNSISVQVAEGTFVFKDLRLNDAYSHLDGEIVNNTSKRWNRLDFNITGIDANGQRIENAYDILNYIHLSSLNPGETKKISASLRGFDQHLPTRVGIKFKDGEYLAEYTFAMLKPKPSDQLEYNDPFIQITFAISKQQIAFVLRNKTSNAISIDWNQVSYIDLSGGSHKVMHEGVKYITRSEPQSPSIIPPTANLKDIVFPIDYVSYSSSRYSSGWREDPLFPEGPAAGKYEGGTFSVFMPLVVNGSSKNYLFSFKIVNVAM